MRCLGEGWGERGGDEERVIFKIKQIDPTEVVYPLLCNRETQTRNRGLERSYGSREAADGRFSVGATIIVIDIVSSLNN